jgi:hypothetical protein
VPNPEIPLPNPPGAPPRPQATPAAPPVAVDDRAVMSLGILGFGLSIPWLTDLYGPLTPAEPLFWVGFCGFIALAAAIWLGNRWLLFKQREHVDWFSHPWRKLVMLVAANVLYTAPVTVLGLLGWFAVAGLAVDQPAIELVVMTNVVCVLFVSHAYETVFLIRERASDLVRVERSERLRAQAELAALKAQVDPHFLFNSLNTLGHLIEHDGARGREFCDALAEVYRYVLDSRAHDLVPLADELAFVARYHRLLELRFGADVLPLQSSIDAAEAGRWRVAPMALQGLLENAVKHNQASAAEPLALRLTLAGGVVTLAHEHRPRRSALPSAGVGLVSLDERCRLLTGRALVVQRDAGVFAVGVPMVAA